MQKFFTEAINLEDKAMPEVRLELMDYKSMEAEAETQIRDAMKILMLGEICRREAKKMIRGFGGKTSEEERAEGRLQRANRSIRSYPKKIV